MLRGNVKARNNEARNARNDFEILQLDAFATPGFHLACRLLSLIAESGFDTTLYLPRAGALLVKTFHL
jgi:hypothetical protein